MATRNSFVLLLTLVCASNVSAQPTLSGSPDELRDLLGLAQPTFRVITLRGHAQETAYADRVIVTVVVTTESRTLAAALEGNTNLRSDLVQTLTAAGIDREMINTARFSTLPQFGFFGNDPNSFQVSNTVEVTVSGEEQFRALGQLVDEHDEVRMAGTQFEHTQKDAFEDEVREAALEDAMAEQAFYEQSLGLTLRPVSFRGGPVVIPRRAAFGAAPALDQIMVTAERANAVAAPQGGSRPAGFDKIEYRADVEIDFEVVAKSD